MLSYIFSQASFRFGSIWLNNKTNIFQHLIFQSQKSGDFRDFRVFLKVDTLHRCILFFLMQNQLSWEGEGGNGEEAVSTIFGKFEDLEFVEALAVAEFSFLKHVRNWERTD